MSVQYLDLLDYLLIAEAVSGIEAQTLAGMPRVTDLASSALMVPQAGWAGHEAYPEFAQKVALLGARLAKNHPLPDGNKRTAFLAMIEFAERNGYEIDVPGVDETVSVMLAVASSEMSENDFVAWIRPRLRSITDFDLRPEDSSTEDRSKWKYEDFGAPYQMATEFVDWLRAGMSPRKAGAAMTTRESWPLWQKLTQEEAQQLVSKLSHVSPRVRYPADNVAFVFCPRLHPDQMDPIAFDRAQYVQLEVVSLLRQRGTWKVHQVGAMLDPRTVRIEPYSW